MDAQGPLVRLRNVTKTYPGSNRPAVAELSLDIHRGEILALLGPNGAGKTTTVKITAGLILPSPSSETVNVMGYDMLRERGQGVRHIGAVLEGARNLYWRLSAHDNLLYFGGLRMVPRGTLHEQIDALLTNLELKEQQRTEVRHFSRGMQQKLALAAALVHDPDVLLLDEPTLGLDVRAARRLEETVVELAKRGKAILLTTHMMGLAERLADRVLVINEGREVDSDSTEALLERYNRQREALAIRVSGGLSESFLAEVKRQYPGLQVKPDTDMTLLELPGFDQSEMLGLLQSLDKQGARILGVDRRKVSLEDVFLSLTETEKGLGVE